MFINGILITQDHNMFKGARTPEVQTPPHLVYHIFGARITVILLFARLFY